jgi:4-amino-4-deoxy-L-arabinose transferase-like glycosyltransferase
MKKYSLILLGIVVLGGILRFWQLGNVPFGITHDEIGYIYNSYSLASTGRNLLGEQYPVFTYLYGKGFPFMPVTTYLSMLVFKVLPLSAFAGRLPNALLGTMSIVLIYWLVKMLFKKESVALLSALALAVSGWHIFWARTAYDIPVAAFFYLLAVVSFFYQIKRNKFTWVSIVSFLLALLSYRGMTPVSLPLMGLLVWYAYATKNATSKTIGAISMGLVLVLLVFGGVLLSQKSNGFIKEATLDMGKIANVIELERRDTRGPEDLKQVFINKPNFILNTWIPNYIQAFSVGHLFLYGEGCQICTISTRGKLYFIDALLILIGIFYLLRIHKDTPTVLFIFGLLAIGALPGTIVGQPYASRAIMMVIPLSILIALGADTLIHVKKIGVLLGVGLLGMYIYSVSFFLYDYHFRYAYQKADVWVSEMKEVVGFITSHAVPNKKAVITGASFVDVLQYAFYSGIPVRDVQRAWMQRKSDQITDFEVGGVRFVGMCAKIPTISQFLNPREISVIAGRPDCFDKEKPIHIVKDFFGNPIWNMYAPVL